MTSQHESTAEFTFKAVATGVALGIVFGAANAYLGLRVGMTISASIPAAVITVAVFAALGRRGTILEANLSQTIIEGVLSGELPWKLVLTGVGVSLSGILCGASGLAFAIGVYLPLSSMAAIYTETDSPVTAARS